MAVRQLSAIYLAGAASFAVAIAVAHHPDLKAGSAKGASWIALAVHDAAASVNGYVLRPAADVMRREIASVRSGGEPRVEIALQPAQGPIATKKTAPADMRAQRSSPLPPAPDLRPSLIPSMATLAETHPPAAPSNSQVSDPQGIAMPDLPKLADVQAKLHLVPQTSASEASGDVPSGDLPSPSYEEIVRVTHHLRESLTREMLAHFGLFLYVSKASAGPWAQHMYVFARQPAGDLRLLHNWPVSTGREKVEYDPAGAKEPSFTPQGYFELDPKRMYEHHVSGQWHTPMPNAMFFNWVNHGYETGLAIHAATGEDVDLLGTRASAGCVRLAPKDASNLFDLVKSKYKGMVPKFAYDPRTRTTSKDGLLMHNAHGRVEMVEGYKVLVFIEDFGGQNVVAALY